MSDIGLGEALSLSASKSVATLQLAKCNMQLPPKLEHEWELFSSLLSWALFGQKDIGMGQNAPKVDFNRVRGIEALNLLPGNTLTSFWRTTLKEILEQYVCKRKKYLKTLIIWNLKKYLNQITYDSLFIFCIWGFKDFFFLIQNKENPVDFLNLLHFCFPILSREISKPTFYYYQNWM